MKADKPMFTGCITFDGNIQVKLLTGELKTLRTDFGGLKLQKADPNKELLVLVHNHVGYDEIDTGYIVRAKIYDDGNPPYFGLKNDPNTEIWACHNYQDVIAWGYADGGLNDPTLFYSCQSTVAEELDRERRRAEKGMKTHAERLAEIEEEQKEEMRDQLMEQEPDCLVVKVRRTEDKGIDLETSWPDAEIRDYVPIVKEDMADCLQMAKDFTDKHPRFKEVHFLNDTTTWMKDIEK